MPEPWATSRSAPLGHSYCRHVVVATEPLIVSDAREHPLLRDSPAVDELGAVAYAGMPLTDEAGNVLGALCAIDVVPRQWTADELDLLRGLAEACSTELRLRLSRFSARDERRQRDELKQRLRGSFDRSQALLAASEALSDSVAVEDMRSHVSELVKTELRPSSSGWPCSATTAGCAGYVTRSLPAGSRTPDPGRPTTSSPPCRRPQRSGSGGSSPTTTGPAFDSDHPESARRLLRDLDLHAIVAVPLLLVGRRLGALALGWDVPRRLDPTELLTLTTLAGYTAQALDRARRLHHRDSVAHQLQQAMLTTLPDVSGLTMSARYQPADSREDVGGDWYDAVPVPTRTVPAAASSPSRSATSSGTPSTRRP